MAPGNNRRTSSPSSCPSSSSPAAISAPQCCPSRTGLARPALVPPSDRHGLLIMASATALLDPKAAGRRFPLRIGFSGIRVSAADKWKRHGIDIGISRFGASPGACTAAQLFSKSLAVASSANYANHRAQLARFCHRARVQSFTANVGTMCSYFGSLFNRCTIAGT